MCKTFSSLILAIDFKTWLLAWHRSAICSTVKGSMGSLQLNYKKNFQVSLHVNMHRCTIYGYMFVHVCVY
jgi:hypothetical protein